MKANKIKLSALQLNDANPRLIKDYKFQKLVKSILTFPEMMNLREIVTDETMTVLGGNMRLRALQHIAQMTEQELSQQLRQFNAGQHEEYWLAWHDAPTADVKIAEGLSDEQKQEFIIKDNVGYGEWDWDALANEWDVDALNDWGVDLPLSTQEEERETAKLSELEINANIYYEPENKPTLSLKDCFNLEKYEKKINYLDSLKLSKQQKDTLKMFAYRFIKIDFESVANYYAFNATEEEKKAIERLRLVLVDGGLDGFIEDEILKIAENE